MKNWLVQKVDPRIGIVEEEVFETKEPAEALAREIRADGYISYLSHLEWLRAVGGKKFRNRLDTETFLPWRDFS